MILIFRNCNANTDGFNMKMAPISSLLVLLFALELAWSFQLHTFPHARKQYPTLYASSKNVKLPVETLEEWNKMRAVHPIPQLKVVGNVSVPKSELDTHPVIRILHERLRSGSQPQARSDPYKVALAIEGGGMRGCVSAGMTAAIKALGIQDCFDVVYVRPLALSTPFHSSTCVIK